MNQKKKKVILPLHKKRLAYIATMLTEMRLSDGRIQSDFAEFGISRRQIQRGEELGSNLSLISLFKLLDIYGYRLDEFFEGME